MELFKTAIQIAISLSIFNVWILRYSKQTIWRGGEAKSMKEEFEIYGLPHWFLNLIGFLKLSLALLLLAGVFVPALIKPAAIGIAVLMLGAIGMHIKVKDSLIKSLPAFIFLVLSAILIFF